MAVDKKLLEILVCPVTKVPVRLLSQDKLAILNRHIEAGDVSRVDGSVLGQPIEEALITQDGKTIYVVDDGIPVMLEDQGIPARQVPGW